MNSVTFSSIDPKDRRWETQKKKTSLCLVALVSTVANEQIAGTHCIMIIHCIRCLESSRESVPVWG